MRKRFQGHVEQSINLKAPLPSEAGARALTSPADDNAVQVWLPPAQTWITTPPSGQKHE